MKTARSGHGRDGLVFLGAGKGLTEELDVLVEAGKQAVEVRRLAGKPAATEFPDAYLNKRQPALEGEFLRFGVSDSEVDGNINVLAHEQGLSV